MPGMSGDLCHKCHARGHECPAQTSDPENDRPLCVFCADGEDCPVIKKQRNAVPEGVAPHDPKTNNEKEKPMAARICASPDCNNPVPARKTSGYCSSKCYAREHWRRKHPPKTAAAAAVKAKPAKPALRNRQNPLKARTVTAPAIIAQTTTAETIDVTVSGGQLNDWFAARPLAERASLFSAWLHRRA